MACQEVWIRDDVEYVRLTAYVGPGDDLVARVVHQLTSEGGAPAEFFVVAGLGARTRGDEAAIPLWHESAFDPELERTVGNPGGRCRMACVDARTSRVTFRAWQ